MDSTAHLPEGHGSDSKQSRGWKFWLIFVSLCASVFLSALDLSSVGTALPVIVNELHGEDSFAWVSAVYTLTCTAILPLSGQLADIWGRRVILLSAIFLFALGSVICATASSMNILIGGRAVQGMGSGGIQSLVAIIIADMVTLKERGLFISLTGAAYSIATAVGPFIAGVFSQKVTWRWQVRHHINLPLCGLAFSVVSLIRLRKPPVESIRKQLAVLDWIGNAAIMASTVSCVLALTWAGFSFPWASVQVLAPLICGVFGLVAALIYETWFATNPCVPIVIMSNRTSLSGYFGTFTHGMVSIIVFCGPLYFQACKLASPLRSGLYFFPMAVMISPAAIIQGITISKTGNYRLVSVLGWVSMLVGIGLLMLATPSANIGVVIVAQLVAAVGVGLLYCTQFSILAPLDPRLNSQALAFLLFLRSFSQTWGVAVGATIIQNHLKHHLPVVFLARFAPKQDIAYSAVPLLKSLSPSLRTEAQEAFSGSLRLLWIVSMALCGIGLLSVAFQKNIPLHRLRDERWGLESAPVTTEKQAEGLDDEQHEKDEVVAKNY
ncbi:iron permease [Favolaschia claudopus]|uniref:Iron permease n=1 Tax=Favolaschia claudopus TaxID=2862362 RepID=A0AAW0EDH2_9AGAR